MYLLVKVRIPDCIPLSFKQKALKQRESKTLKTTNKHRSEASEHAFRPQTNANRSVKMPFYERLEQDNEKRIKNRLIKRQQTEEDKKSVHTFSPLVNKTDLQRNESVHEHLYRCHFKQYFERTEKEQCWKSGTEENIGQVTYIFATWRLQKVPSEKEAVTVIATRRARSHLST